MAILSLTDLVEAERRGWLKVENHQGFSPFSINLNLGKLYRRKERFIIMDDSPETSQEEFIASLEEVSLGADPVIIQKGMYFWQPQEKVFLARGLWGEVTSRSSTARLGMKVWSKGIDDYLSKPEAEVDASPLCALITTGTTVALHQGSPMGQLFVHHGWEYVVPAVVKKMMDENELVLRKEGKVLSSSEVEMIDGQIVLHMHPEIQIYNEGILQPGTSPQPYFKKITLATAPIWIPEFLFFISCSEEEVEIPSGFVGYVTENVVRRREVTCSIRPEGQPLNYASHANAPYVGPRTVFKGKVTFENFLYRNGAEIHAGMKQSELRLVPLVTPLTESQPSRYNNQQGATLSRL